MHNLKDTTVQIKIIKMTQGYTLGKPNEGENPSKNSSFYSSIYITLWDRVLQYIREKDNHTMPCTLADLALSCWESLDQDLRMLLQESPSLYSNYLEPGTKNKFVHLQKLDETRRWSLASDLGQTGGLQLGRSSRSGTPLRVEHGSTLGFLISLVVREI